MINDLFGVGLQIILRAQLAGSGAILLVLLVRVPTRRLLGAELSYSSWALPVAAMVSSLFPTLTEFMQRTGGDDAVAATPLGVGSGLLIMAWSLGLIVTAGLFVGADLMFRRLIRRGAAGPAVMGVGWSRLILPNDFQHRFSPEERQFILRHERTHMARKDPLANVILAGVQAMSWFNPIVHLAAGLVRLDQELACDEAVIRYRPQTRRGYAETLIKAHLSHRASPFACGFGQKAWAISRHPLEVRVMMLARPEPSLLRQLTGASAVVAACFLLAVGVWVSGSGTPSSKETDLQGPYRGRADPANLSVFLVRL